MDVRARRDGDLLADPRRGAIAAVAALVAVLVLTLLVAVDVAAPPLLARADAEWRDAIEPTAAWAERVSHWLYVAGSGQAMVPLRLAVALVLALRRRWVDLAAWLAGWALADLVTQLLKPGLGRMRPDLSDASSFPSGHAKTAAQVSVGLVLVATSPWRSRAWAWAIAVAWIVAMAASRTVLVDHYLSDVVAGSLLGAGCAVGTAAWLQLARDRRVARSTLPDRDSPS
jgi:undecaprenyl-diphosphatase